MNHDALTFLLFALMRIATAGAGVGALAGDIVIAVRAVHPEVRPARSSH